MDIEYLLILQNFREATGNVLSPLMNWISKFSVSFWAFAMMLIIYWVIDRKAGKNLIAGLGAGLFANGFLKLTFCVYRPWIRAIRVEPFGDSKVAATGYSFPSGHSTWATAVFGGIGMWVRKISKLLAVLFFALVALTLFSRNYLGVHTPQDVVVGFLTTSLMMYLMARLEKWSEEDPSRDRMILVAGLILCAAAVVYYMVKPYPLTVLEDGSLLVDPKKMIADSFEGIGYISSYVICRYIEKRKFAFDTQSSRKTRLIIAILALIPAYFWMTGFAPAIMAVNRNVGKFFQFFVIIIYSMIIVPWVMTLTAHMTNKNHTKQA